MRRAHTTPRTARARRRLLSPACALVGTLLGAGAVSSAWGQTVAFKAGSRGSAVADQVLRRVIERGAYRVLTQDTILGPDETISADVILLRATLRVEGRIRGDLVGVESDIFARPGGRVDGTVVALNSGFYGSSLARLSSPPIDAALYDYRVEEREDGTFLIVGPARKAALRLPGLKGFLVPRYDRVNALTVRWGIELERGPAPWMPAGSARLRYRSVRTDLDGDVELRWPLGRHQLAVGGGLTVRSNDTWTNGNLTNSLHSLIGAADTRNYYEARFVEAGVRLEYGAALSWWVGVSGAWERARSLANRDPFSIFSARGGFQPNLPVDEADAVSGRGVLGAKLWLSQRSALELEVNLERADADLGGDLSFTVVSSAARLRMMLPGDHRLLVRARGQTTGSTGAPPQRWRALGGWGSLPTLRAVARAGDRMWWTAVSYHLPIVRRVDLLGALEGWVEYAIGNAWVVSGGARPSAVHNLGVGVALGPLAGGVFVDPDRDFEAVFLLGFEGRRGR